AHSEANMPNSADAKQILQDLKKLNPAITTPGRQYKKKYSEAVWALVEQLVHDNEQLERRSLSLEDTLKAVVNQGQIAISEGRHMRKLLMESMKQLKALPAPGKDEDDDD